MGSALLLWSGCHIVTLTRQPGKNRMGRQCQPQSCPFSLPAVILETLGEAGEGRGPSLNLPLTGSGLWAVQSLCPALHLPRVQAPRCASPGQGAPGGGSDSGLSCLPTRLCSCLGSAGHCRKELPAASSRPPWTLCLEPDSPSSGMGPSRAIYRLRAPGQTGLRLPCSWGAHAWGAAVPASPGRPPLPFP